MDDAENDPRNWRENVEGPVVLARLVMVPAAAVAAVAAVRPVASSPPAVPA